jgi:hypothetical protein
MQTIFSSWYWKRQHINSSKTSFTRHLNDATSSENRDNDWIEVKRFFFLLRIFFSVIYIASFAWIVSRRCHNEYELIIIIILNIKSTLCRFSLNHTYDEYSNQRSYELTISSTKNESRSFLFVSYNREIITTWRWVLFDDSSKKKRDREKNATRVECMNILIDLFRRINQKKKREVSFVLIDRLFFFLYSSILMI